MYIHTHIHDGFLYPTAISTATNNFGNVCGIFCHFLRVRYYSYSQRVATPRVWCSANGLKIDKWNIKTARINRMISVFLSGGSH